MCVLFTTKPSSTHTECDWSLHCLVFVWYANFINIENPIVVFIMTVVWKFYAAHWSEVSSCLENDSITVTVLSDFFFIICFLCFETIYIQTSSFTQTFHTRKNINTWEQNLKTQIYELLLKIPSYIDHLFSKEMCWYNLFSTL